MLSKDSSYIWNETNTFTMIGKNTYSETRGRQSFHEAESFCEFHFKQLGKCWHLYTPEDFEIIFSDDNDFRAGMTLFALCALDTPGVTILTFEWMNNHLHATLAGEETDIRRFFKKLALLLERYLRNRGRTTSLKQWTYRLRAISDLRDMRSVIAYNNRNGYLVNDQETPFTYPWGANRFFYNPSAGKDHIHSKDRLKVRDIWDTFHTRRFDKLCGLVIVDGYVSPLEYCHIREAEALFRDAHQYYYAISRDYDIQRRLAKEFGDRVTYTDNELYAVVADLCKDSYGASSPAVLDKEAKTAVARKMHFDYNASDKQISRILRLETNLVHEMFSKK